MPMDLILTQDVPNLGKAGDLVSVKPGYGRNYLLPQQMAVSATRRNKSRLEHEQKQIGSRVAKELAEIGGLAERINGMTLQFERRVGDDDKLFGSVTSRDITEQLSRAGLDIDHRKLMLDEPIRALGKFEVGVKLKGNVVASLKFWVVGKDGE